MKVFFFGDSITQGFWDSGGGWAARVRREIDAGYIQHGGVSFDSIFDLGISGEATDRLTERFDDEVRARLPEGGDAAFVFTAGTNDTHTTAAGGDYSSPSRYAYQLGELVAKTRQYSDKIAFVGLTPVQDELLNPLPASTTGKSYTTKRMRVFDQVLREFCAREGVVYIDIWDGFATQSLKGLMFDGLHPNDKGHQIIASKVIKFLEDIR